MSQHDFPAKTMIDAEYPPPPGQVEAWHREHNLLGAGVYIGGPFQAPTTWNPDLVHDYHHAGITGFMPIFVGQQQGPTLGDGTFSYYHGRQDGDLAINKSKAFGWKPNSLICLDVEYETTQNAGPELRDYVRGWCDQLNNERFWPYIYCPPTYVPSLFGTSCAGIWVSAWIAETFVPALHPLDVEGVSIHAWSHRRAWQYASGITDGHSVDWSVYNHSLNPCPGYQ